MDLQLHASRARRAQARAAAGVGARHTNHGATWHAATLHIDALFPAESNESGWAVGLQSVAVSSCGNFGIAGAQSGRIDKYNLQSGLHRGGIDGRTRRAAVFGTEDPEYTTIRQLCVRTAQRTRRR